MKPEILDKLSESECFPVIGPNGVFHWMHSRHDFAIPDRKQYSERFRGQIDILDFTLEEVHEMKKIFEVLGMEKLFLSRLVKVHTSAEGGDMSDRLTSRLRKKAYAICR